MLPLPLRLLFLLDLGVLSWYSNLTLLKAVGIDANDLVWQRTAPSPTSPTEESPRNLLPTSSHEPSPLPPLLDWKIGYRIAGYWTALVAVGVACHARWAQNPPIHPPTYPICAFLPFVRIPTSRLHIPLFSPALRKIAHILPFSQVRQYPSQPIKFQLVSRVTFLDVLMFDVLTSFAKVGGDMWEGLADWLTAFSYLSVLRGNENNEVGWGKCFVVSLPYICRLRHCISECFTTSSPSIRRRSIANAVKYFSSFPVIVLSTLMGRHADPFDEEHKDQRASDIISLTSSSSSLFRLWLIAVFINSLYSFWWDVTNDWGLRLFLPESWKKASLEVLKRRNLSHQTSGHQPLQELGSSDGEQFEVAEKRAESSQLKNVGSRHRSGSLEMPTSSRPTGSKNSSSIAPSEHPFRSHKSSASAPSIATFRSRPSVQYHLLRPFLVLRDPSIYYAIIVLDFMLRITWSIKLSAHLHHVSEIESGIFLLEILEIVRRWLWIFFRVEWEWIKRSGLQQPDALEGELDKVPIDDKSEPLSLTTMAGRN
ncbi:EXS-domain-containing protein [Atractiella rhizophila]|nr:EXS-domain-containing protein [Atractiella rhizophila]